MMQTISKSLTKQFTISGSNAGMVYMILAMVLLPIGDTFAKLLGASLSPVGITLCRVLAQTLFLIPITIIMRRRLRGAMFSPIVALSGFLVIVSLTSLISAFSIMPIATAIAIFFVEPLILTILASLILGETAGPRRIIAVGVGLLGALIIIRPGFSAYGWSTLLPVVSAFAYALNMIVLKKATTSRSGLTVQCGTTIYAALGLVLVSVLIGGSSGYQGLIPSLSDTNALLLIFVGGIVTAGSFILVAEAYRSTDATTLASFQYFEIITATALGFLVFGDFPDILTSIGLTIILGSGVYVFHREGQSETSAPRRKRGGR